MGRNNPQRQWARKSKTSESGARKTTTTASRGASNNDGDNNSSDVTLTQMQAFLEWGQQNKLESVDNSSSVGHIISWVDMFEQKMGRVPELQQMLIVFSECTPFNELPQQEELKERRIS